MRIALEWGCLPCEVEEKVTAAEFWEFVAYFKIRDEIERKAIEDARRKSGHEQRTRR